MKVTRILAALALVTCFAGAANAAPGCIRTSWNSCDPWQMNQQFTGPTTYNLVVSSFGTGDPNVGTDLNLHIFSPLPNGAVPDSWRFDDSGCQTSSQLVTSNAGLSKLCPVMKGLNALTIVNYAADAQGQADLRLAITYDQFNPVATTRYTIWQLAFNHAFSVAGPSDPGLTCGGAEVCEFMYFTQALLLAATGTAENFTGCDVPVGSKGQPSATWQAAPPGVCPVPSAPATWGKVKGLYR